MLHSVQINNTDVLHITKLISNILLMMAGIQELQQMISLIEHYQQNNPINSTLDNKPSSYFYDN